MYKVFVADDNTLTVQVLRASVPWEEWGFTLIGAAENGVDAKEGIERLRPDIAILDINMPGMTGLETAEALREECRPLLIFLTAYDEFSYAHTALKIGAFDYLLKPLDNEKLKQVLQRAAAKLDEERQSAAFEKRMREDYINRTGYLLKESVSGVGHFTSELEETLKREWKSAGYELMLADTVDMLEPEQLDDLTRENRRCLDGLEERFGFRYASVPMKEGFLVMLGFRKVQMVRDYDLTALKIANRLVDASRALGVEVFVGISNFSERLEALPRMYEEATFAAGSRFFLENKTVVHYGSMTSKNCRNEYILSRKMQDMFRILYTRPEDFEDLLEDFIGMMLEDNSYDPEYVRNIFTQVAFTISCSMREKNTVTGVKSMDEILEDTKKTESMQELITWIRDYAGATVGQLEEENCLMSGQGRRALDYINTHYMENITLQDVADDVGISESHLCRVLKKEAGESFVNILNKVRVQQAQKLLKKGELKVYEIAERVGFSNYAYFYQVFKKITGCSPKEYH